MRKTLDRSKHEKNIKQRDIVQHNWQVFLSTVKAIKNKKILRIHLSQEEFTEMWRLIVMSYPGWNPGTKKEHELNTNEIWMKYGL